MQKRSFADAFINSLLALAGALFIAAAPAHAELVVDRDYVALEPAQPTESAPKIEVLEFFSYACPHCNDFHPLVSKWAAKLPADVVFKRVPVSFGRGQWANLSRLYYTLEATGDLHRLDGAVFNALHAQGQRLYDEKSIAEWAAKQGVDTKKFVDTFNSFGVMSKVKRADQMAQSYKIQGVPSLAVEGKYLVVGREVKGPEGLLPIADQLIDKVRAEKGKKK